MSRKGARMLAAVAYVTAHPGCSKYAAATAANGETARNPSYGYAPIDRAIAAGMIEARREGRRYGLYLTDGATVEWA